MSVRGLEESELMAEKLLKQVKHSLSQQTKEIKQELAKMQYLLNDPQERIAWASQPANAQRLADIQASMTEVERLYLEAGDSNGARLFKSRMEREFTSRLTNLKANELEVKLKVEKAKRIGAGDLTRGLSEIRQQAALSELYQEARQSGGFFAQFGKPYLNDLVTLETKSAGSKTLGQYMSTLYDTYEKGLKDVFVAGIVRGDSYKQMQDNLTKTAQVTAGKAQLLVRTEANAIFNDSVRQVLDDNPLVKGYVFRATLDSRTSKICQEHDGEYIPKKDAKPGVNYPPLHPNCRSTVTTVFIDENEKQDTIQRYTKNRSNEWVKVPLGMKYPEFEATVLHPPATTPIVRRSGRFSETVRREMQIRPDDPRIEDRDGTKIVPNVIGSAVLLDNQMTTAVSQAAQAAYTRAITQEPAITQVMLNVADQYEGGALSGIENVCKTASSTEQKIFRLQDKAKKANKVVPTDDEAVSSMGDLVRYTLEVPHDDVVSATNSTMESISKAGYEVIELDNKWVDGDGTYKAVHIGVKTDQGMVFEIQVHSPEDLKIKNRNHFFYEQARAVGVSDEKRTLLRNKMEENWKSIEPPKGIETLVSFIR